MGFFQQEYWSGLPFPLPGYHPDPGIEPACPALTGGFFTIGPQGKPHGRADQLLKHQVPQGLSVDILWLFLI